MIIFLKQEINKNKNIKKILENCSDSFLMKNSSIILASLDQENVPKGYKVIIKIVDQYGFCQTLKKFLGFLATKNRLFFLNQIIDSFLDLVSSSKGELKAKLLSSKELSKAELEKIRNELSKDFQSPIKIDYKHDPDLIAGIVIQVGSVMVDTSIKSKLRQLQKVMIEA